MNEIKNEIENIQWQIQLLRRFAIIGAMSQPDEDNFKRVAQDMENAVNRLNSLLLKEKYSKYYMTTCLVFLSARNRGLLRGVRRRKRPTDTNEQKPQILKQN